AAWEALFAEVTPVAGKLKGAGADKHKALMVQAQIPLQLAELGPLLVEALKKRGTAGQNVVAALGLYAGQAIRQVEVHGTVMATYASVYNDLLLLQPKATRSSASERAMVLNHRQRVFRAQLIAQGKDPDAQQNWA